MFIILRQKIMILNECIYFIYFLYLYLYLLLFLNIHWMLNI